VGISIGATRLFSQLLEMNLIGAARAAVAHVLVLSVEPALAAECARMAAERREAGLNVEVYGGDDKLGKQLKYADRSKIPLALIYGSREREGRRSRQAERSARGRGHQGARARRAARRPRDQIKQLVA